MPSSILDRPYFRDEAAAYAKLESIVWPNGPMCVHCGEMRRLGLLKGKATRPGVYKCYACRKQFRVTVNTVFEASHIPLRHWLQAVFLMCGSKKGISSNQMHRTMGVTLKTGWFMTHRIREAMKTTDTDMLGGAGETVEGDETYIGRKSESKAFKPPSVKQSVMALVERNGRVRSFHVPNVTANNLRPIIGRHAHPDSRFMTDESPIYTMVGATVPDRVWHHTRRRESCHHAGRR